MTTTTRLALKLYFINAPWKIFHLQPLRIRRNSPTASHDKIPNSKMDVFENIHAKTHHFIPNLCKTVVQPLHAHGILLQCLFWPHDHPHLHLLPDQVSLLALAASELFLDEAKALLGGWASGNGPPKTLKQGAHE